MAQVNHRDKSYRSGSLRLRLVGPSVSLVICSQRPDALKEDMESQELTLLFRKARVQSSRIEKVLEEPKFRPFYSKK